jgi:hypothetical protein
MTLSLTRSQKHKRMANRVNSRCSILLSFGAAVLGANIKLE